MFCRIVIEMSTLAVLLLSALALASWAQGGTFPYAIYKHDRAISFWCCINYVRPVQQMSGYAIISILDELYIACERTYFVQVNA